MGAMPSLRSDFTVLAALLLFASGGAAASDVGSPDSPGAVHCAPGRASELLEQGQRTQREKGEGGADEAIALYRKALELDASCTPALWELGWSFFGRRCARPASAS